MDKLRNPDTAASFYVVRQANSTLDDVISFDLDVTDWQGNTTVPITLNGRVWLSALPKLGDIIK